MLEDRPKEIFREPCRKMWCRRPNYRDLLVVGCIWVCAAALFAGTNELDLLRMKLEVTLLPEKKQIEEVARLTISIADDTTKSIGFLLNPGLEILQAESNAGNLSWSRTGQWDGRWSTIESDEAFRRGEIERTLHVGGRISDIHGRQTQNPEADFLRDDHALLLWEDAWYPQILDDRASVEITVIAPDNFEVFADGELVATHKTADERTWHFASVQPLTDFTVVADTAWNLDETVVSGCRIRTYLYSEHSGKYADRIQATSQQVLACYGDYFMNYPFPVYAFIEQEGIDYRRALNSGVLYSPSYLESVMAKQGYDAHETALIWWGGILSGKGPRANQWMEAFGDYAEWLFASEQNLPLDPFFETKKLSYLSIAGSDQDSPLANLQGEWQDIMAVVHGKGPRVMRVLHRWLGDNGFKKAMRHLFSTFQFEAIDLEQMQQCLEESAETDLGPFFDSWICGKGVPQLRLSWSLQNDTEKWVAEGKVEQRDPEFLFPMDIEFAGESGRKVTRTILIHGLTTDFRFDLDFPPKSVRMDPEDWILWKPF
jgi:hypothetical protein